MVTVTPDDFSPPGQTDTSMRARSLARAIDRLPDGTYMLKISKTGREPWVYELIQPVTIRSGTLPKESAPE